MLDNICHFKLIYCNDIHLLLLSSRICQSRETIRSIQNKNATLFDMIKHIFPANYSIKRFTFQGIAMQRQSLSTSNCFTL